MSFADDIRSLGAKAKQDLSAIHGEANTVSVLIRPFIKILGYDPESISEVTEQFPVKLGKKTRKVDFAILKDKEPVILLEAKPVGAFLEKSFDQLARYFANTPKARFAVLTNGVMFRFYSDIDEPNGIDSDPFLSFDIRHIDESSLMVLERFSKQRFNAEAIQTSIKQSREIRRVLDQQLKEPTHTGLLRFFADRLGKELFPHKVKNRNNLNRIKPVVRQVLSEYLKVPQVFTAPSEPFVGGYVRIRKTSRMKSWHGKVVKVRKYFPPGAIQVEDNGVRKWMSPKNVEVVTE